MFYSNDKIKIFEISVLNGSEELHFLLREFGLCYTWNETNNNWYNKQIKIVFVDQIPMALISLIFDDICFISSFVSRELDSFVLEGNLDYLNDYYGLDKYQFLGAVSTWNKLIKRRRNE